MKPFNLTILVFLILIAGGFLFFKDSFNTASKPPASSRFESSMNRMNYLDYSESTLKKASESGRIVLFFAAPWCSTCTALDDEIRQKSNQLPNDVTILKVNFDTQKDLKKKYQVTQQHTLIQINKDGNEVTKWIGGNFDLLKQQLKED